MTASASTRPVFVLDVDNTLLDNDALKADIDHRLRALVGDAAAARFWQIYEDVRMASDVVNYPLALEVFADELRDAELARKLHELVMDDDFARYVYPDTFPTLAHLRTLGLPVIVSDGDSVYQPLKIERSAEGEDPPPPPTPERRLDACGPLLGRYGVAAAADMPAADDHPGAKGLHRRVRRLADPADEGGWAVRQNAVRARLGDHIHP